MTPRSHKAVAIALTIAVPIIAAATLWLVAEMVAEPSLPHVLGVLFGVIVTVIYAVLAVRSFKRSRKDGA